MKNIYEYLAHQSKSGYLPKEQLNRVMKSQGLTNTEAALVIGLSPATVASVKTVTNDQTKFRKTHAFSLRQFTVSRTMRNVDFEKQRTNLGFIISYTAATWDHRIDTALKYDTLASYNLALDSYFATLPLDIVQHDQTLVVSLLELAKATSQTPLEVLEQVKQKIKPTYVDEAGDIDDFDDVEK